MKKLNLETAEILAAKMRGELLRVSNSEPLNMKTVLRQLNVMTLYRPLSDKLFGLSLLTPDKKHRFMLVNSNSRRGRQHFTIAHELYHCTTMRILSRISATTQSIQMPLRGRLICSLPLC